MSPSLGNKAGFPIGKFFRAKQIFSSTDMRSLQAPQFSPALFSSKM